MVLVTKIWIERQNVLYLQRKDQRWPFYYLISFIRSIGINKPFVYAGNKK